MENAASPRILSGFEPAARTSRAALIAPTQGAPTRLGYSSESSAAISRSSAPACAPASTHWRARSLSERPYASPGLVAARPPMRAAPDSARHRSRTSEGAVTSRESTQQAIRAMCDTVCSRASISGRSAAAHPASSLAGRDLPAATLSHAASASMASLLPRRRCSRRGLTTSRTSNPRPDRYAARPAP